MVKRRLNIRIKPEHDHSKVPDLPGDRWENEGGFPGVKIEPVSFEPFVAPLMPGEQFTVISIAEEMVNGEPFYTVLVETEGKKMGESHLP